MSAGTAELRALALEFETAPARGQKAARKSLAQGARWVATDMRDAARDHRYLPHFPKSVSWELNGPLSAEIGHGPKKGTQGALAHILLHGSVNNAPIYDYTLPLQRNAGRIERLFGDELASAVLVSGGK